VSDIYEEIRIFAEGEKEEAEKALQTEENQVCIKADSYIAKEIKYQTALLHHIFNRLNEISLSEEKGNISFTNYLISMVGQEKAKEILSMTQQEKENRLIIITGRQGPTGKSALKRILRKHGYWVLEPCECVEVVLNKELQQPIPDFTCLVD
jgi:hypothetical protein